MKLSRRGKHKKHARRARHTKRAGKHLRYKTKSKKFRASKRYHRGNKRTYKRGKRFHRGGVQYDVMFFVSKKGPYLEEEQLFTMTIELDDENIATVKLVRKDKQNITFTIKGAYDDVIKLLKTPDAPINVGGKNVDFKKLDDDNKTGTYDFYRNGQNNNTFRAIVNNLESLYQTNYDILMSQNRVPSSVSGLDPANQLLDTVQVFKAMEVATNRSREWTKNDGQRQNALQSSLSTTVGQGDPKIDYYQEYRLPITLGGDMSPSYNNYVGRFKLVTDTLTPQLYDVYYSGGLVNDNYRNGFIHLFAVRSDPRTSDAKRNYLSEYTILSKQFLVFTERDFSKIKNIYANRESTGRFTLKDTPAVQEIIGRLNQISRAPYSVFNWQKEATNNDEQQNGWKPEVVHESLFV